ncbi:MAG: hypothetical protein ACOX42_07005 [Clostridia bacterium]
MTWGRAKPSVRWCSRNTTSGPGTGPRWWCWPITLKGYSEVRSIATGSSQGVFFNFDWGAADDYA